MKFSTIATMFVVILTAISCTRSAPSDLDFSMSDPVSLAQYKRLIAQIDYPSIPLFHPVSGDTTLTQAELNAYENAIGRYESGNNYYAVSSEPWKGHLNVGRFQITETMIPVLTQTYLGFRVEPQDFLVNPTLQDLTFEMYTQSLYTRYHSIEDCASVWISGRPFYTQQNWHLIDGTAKKTFVGSILRHM